MPSLEPGTLIDRRYVVGERIGRGGMGEVYAARQQGIGGFERRVALKIVRPEVGDEENIDRLITEAKLLSQLHHPAIVSVLDVGRDGTLVYVVMELLEGLNLARVLKMGPPPLAVSVEVLLRAAEGLGCAHERGIVHRDVSPQNIFLCHSGVVKVLDFGIARSETATTHTVTGVVRGKPGYMSPEQAMGERVDVGTDVFALGIVAWEMLTGQRLFQAENDLKTLRLVQHGQIPPLPNEVPAELSGVITRALEREPSARTSSCVALVAELEAVQVKLGLPSGASIVADHLADAHESLARDVALFEIGQAKTTPPLSTASATTVDQSPVPRADVVRPPAAATTVVQPAVAPSRAVGAPVGAATAVVLLAASGIGIAFAIGQGAQQPEIVVVEKRIDPPPPPAPSPAPPPAAVVEPEPQPIATKTAKPKKLTPAPPPAPPPAAVAAPVSGTGFLTVPDRDPYVRVFVDGNEVGISPLFKKRIPAGPHVIELRDAASGKTVVTKEVNVDDGRAIVVK